MLSEVIALEVLALVKKTHTPVSATSVPSVTNTLAFLLRPAAVVMEDGVVVGVAVLVVVLVVVLGAGVGVAVAAAPVTVSRRDRSSCEAAVYERPVLAVC